MASESDLGSAYGEGQNPARPAKEVLDEENNLRKESCTKGCRRLNDSTPTGQMTAMVLLGFVEFALNGHPGRYWEGRAVVMFCACCMTMGQHPYEKCPYRPKDRAPFVPRTVVVWSTLDTTPYESSVPDVY
ncbi:hypothetical protein EV2_036508 [Malus domestica]